MMYRKLGRTSSNRKALLRSLTVALIKHGRIETTTAKAKELTKVFAKLLTTAKEDTLANRRLVIAALVDEDAVRKLFTEIAPKYMNRKGGYTRMYRVGPRRGDAAEIAIIEMVAPDEKTAE